MASDSSRSDKIQASVAAALSRLRGDLSTFTPKSNPESGKMNERREPHLHASSPPLFEESGDQPQGSAPPIHSVAQEHSVPRPMARPMPPLNQPTFPRETEEDSISMPAIPDLPNRMAQTPLFHSSMSEAPENFHDTDEISSDAISDNSPVSGLYPNAGPDLAEATASSQVGFTLHDASQPALPPVSSFSIEPMLSGQEEQDADLLSHLNSPSPIAGLEMNAGVSPDILSGPRIPKIRYLLIVLAVLIAGIGTAVLWYGGGEEVPIIEADQQPEKVKPSADQANQVPNQNVQVYDAMHGQNSNNGQPEIITPAPQAPGPEVAPGTSAPPASPIILQTQEDPNSAFFTPPDAPAPQSQASSSQSVPNDTPQVPEAPPPAGAEASSGAPAPEITSVKPATVTKPAPPQNKPVASVTKPAATASKPAATSGGGRIQLGAVKSEEIAQKEWTKIQKAHSDLLGKLSLHVEKVQSNGVTLYRVQAGPFADKAAAQKACASLKARGTDCIAR